MGPQAGGNFLQLVLLCIDGTLDLSGRNPMKYGWGVFAEFLPFFNGLSEKPYNWVVESLTQPSMYLKWAIQVVLLFIADLCGFCEIRWANVWRENLEPGGHPFRYIVNPDLV